ncbi:MAG: PaaI family thioesterase [Thermoanaerobaculia bacterium]
MTDAPDLHGEDGWQPLRRFNEARTAESYVSGEPDGRRLRIRYYRRTRDDALTGRVWFGPGTQGPPGHAHGGATAALLDEAMGFCCWLVGHRVVAAHVEIDFRRMMPVGAVATLEAAVERVEGRKVFPRARLLLPDGTLAAEATGVFLELAADQLELLAGRAEAAGMDPEAFA